ncbi:MAG: nucleotidyltransferase substrate binding protein [Alphaproteobacteria bacterium]
MSVTKSALRILQLSRAIRRLEEALALPPEAPVAIDGTIQRFEFTFELAWKAVQALLEEQGVLVSTPRSAIKEAYAAGWITNEAPWIDMLKARNLTSHTYDEARALEVYRQIREDFPALVALGQRLKSLIPT